MDHILTDKTSKIHVTIILVDAMSQKTVPIPGLLITDLSKSRSLEVVEFDFSTIQYRYE